MKIAIIHPDMGKRGGAEYIVVWLAEELCRRGYTVALFTHFFDEQFWGKERGRERSYSVETVKGNALAIGRKLAGKLSGYDIINPHNHPATIWVWWAVKFNQALRKAKLIWFCEEPRRLLYPRLTEKLPIGKTIKKSYFPRKGFLRRFLGFLYHVLISAFSVPAAAIGRSLLISLDKSAISMFDVIAANSKFSAGLVRDIYGRDAIATHLGIDLSEKVSSGSSLKGKFILCVNHLLPFKNIQIVIEAYALFIKEIKEPPLLKIVGTGYFKYYLEYIIKAKGLQRLVEFEGEIHGEKLKEYYSQAKVLVYTPLNEPFGLVPVEAMANGCPVIASGQGGCSETVIHNETGILVDPLDPQDIARAIERVFNDNRFSERLAGRAKERVAAYFTLDKFVDRFLAALKKDESGNEE